MMLDSAVSLLPVKLQDKAKALVAVLGVVVGVGVQFWPGHPAWVDSVVAVLTALGVYAVPNLDHACLAAAAAPAPPKS